MYENQFVVDRVASVESGKFSYGGSLCRVVVWIDAGEAAESLHCERWSIWWGEDRLAEFLEEAERLTSGLPDTRPLRVEIRVTPDAEKRGLGEIRVLGWRFVDLFGVGEWVGCFTDVHE